MNSTLCAVAKLIPMAHTVWQEKRRAGALSPVWQKYTRSQSIRISSECIRLSIDETFILYARHELNGYISTQITQHNDAPAKKANQRKHRKRASNRVFRLRLFRVRPSIASSRFSLARILIICIWLRRHFFLTGFFFSSSKAFHSARGLNWLTQIRL